MLRIIPNKNNIGAEIDTDIQKLSKENFKIIMNALNKYGMIFFRRQNLSSKHYVEFAKNFGKLADYPRLKGPVVAWIPLQTLTHATAWLRFMLKVAAAVA